MKRMKKKVVAMVTLAMFMMTLLPMAAFAATKVDLDQSYFKTTVENEAVDVNEEFGVELRVNDEKGNGVNTPNGVTYVWLEDENGDVVYDVSYKVQSAWQQGVVLSNGYAFKATGNGTGLQAIKVSKAGEYTLKAGFLLGDNSGDKLATNDKNDLVLLKGSADYDTYQTVSVDKENVTVDKITVAGAKNETEKGGNLLFATSQDPDKAQALVPNGITKLEVNATVAFKKNDNGTDPDKKDQVVTIENRYNNIAIVDAQDKAIEEVKTDNKGNVRFFVRPDASVGDGYYTFTLKAGDASYDLSIKIGEDDKDVKTLEVVDTDATVVAKDEKVLDSVAKFIAKDEKGNVVAPEPLAAAVDVITEPKKNKAEFEVVKVKDEDAYTLQVKDDKELAVGDYVVRVALTKERSSIDLEFTVDKFGEAVDIKFGDVKDAAGTKVENDKVVVDKTYTGEVLLVDKNGVTKRADKATIGVSGDAATSENVTSGTYGFKVAKSIKDTADNNETSVGSEITVTVYDNTVKKNIQKVFTVVDSEDAKTLAFDSEAGKVQENNTVKVTLVDENGDVVKEKADNPFNYYVVSQSNEDANIHVATTENLNKDGKGKITVYSDKETTAEIVVYVQINNKVYGNTLKYTFGAEDVLADTSVVMTLGSTEMLVNNNIVDMKDAAPFAQNNRTYVPFRALGEALGAQVDYDKDAKTVTYTLGGTEIVMTLDSKTYTVNGAEKTMDVAPFAKDNRTYVPVRFVGEALGFKVTGLQNGAGQYVGVAFTK